MGEISGCPTGAPACADPYGIPFVSCDPCGPVSATDSDPVVNPWHMRRNILIVNGFDATGRDEWAMTANRAFRWQGDAVGRKHRRNTLGDNSIRYAGVARMRRSK